MHHLLGLFDSPYVRRVAITMTHYGIPFEHTSLSVFRHMEQMRPLNPLFKVPLLSLPNGERMYESAYQLDYLDELARDAGVTPLTPPNGADRRAVLQGVALALIATEKAVALAYERRRPEALVWVEWVERVRQQMRDALEQCDVALEQNGGQWMVGKTMTQADVTLAVTVGFIRFVLPDEWQEKRCSLLGKHASRMEALQAFQAVPIDKE